MKKLKALFLFLASVLCAGLATACLDTTFTSNPSDSVEDSSVEETTSDSVEDSSEDETTSDSTEDSSGETDEEDDFGKGYETITIAQALELCGEPGNTTAEKYYVIGTIDELKNSQYGEMTISDETGSLYVYGISGFSALEEKPYAGDKVLLYGTLKNYNGTKEMHNDAVLIDFVRVEQEINEEDYTEMSIADARNAEADALVKVSGVVAQITYANGKIPNGLILIDETQSIYVYDGTLADRVEEGNKITILAKKAYWILEDEQLAAEKFGYKGCNQLTEAILKDNDEGKNEFPLSGIQENTVKEMLETPVAQDITSIVYKVNALVKKAPGSGFVNYYFNDIDGETGGYTYTQCNGSDFAWLDEFDGKICTVYLTVLNAKSTATGCVYRFLPVAVKDEGYKFDTANAAQFAVEYYGADQFAEKYTADPNLELNTVVSSELLGFEGTTLSYKSSNEAVVYFETVEGKTYMHCGEYGKATVTVTGAYGGKEYSAQVEITMEKATSYNAITVAEAIEAAVDTNVVVKGIVGPSVVNKNGFYLFGEDGSVIAVLVNDLTQFVGLEIGHEVVLTGMRERYIKDDANTVAGQTCIVNAEILVNNFGNHEYSTAKFITDKTLADILAFSTTEDHTTEVYVITATVKVVAQTYFSNIYLKSGDAEIRLYTSSAAQYSWLNDGEEVIVELAPCNWNDQSKAYVGCVLAVRNADGTKTYNTLNFDNN